MSNALRSTSPNKTSPNKHGAPSPAAWLPSDASQAAAARAGTPESRPRPAKESQHLVEQLAREVQGLEQAGRRPEPDRPTISCGCEAMDACLPYHGYPLGSVVEYLRTSAACGASYLAFTSAALAMQQQQGFLVIVDTQHVLYPSALTGYGIDLERVVVVRPRCYADGLWSIDQSLRTPAVAAVVAEVPSLDDRTARRMQLAAEQGNGLALLLRGAAARHQPSWAEVQWVVRGQLPNASKRTRSHGKHSPIQNCASRQSVSQPTSFASARSNLNEYAGHRPLSVELARVRGGRPGKNIALEIDAITGKLRSRPGYGPCSRPVHSSMPLEREYEKSDSMHLAPQLASTTHASRRSAAG